MNVALRKPVTVVDFLVWEASQDVKYEFDGVDVRAWSGCPSPMHKSRRTLSPPCTAACGIQVVASWAAT